MFCFCQVGLRDIEYKMKYKVTHWSCNTLWRSSCTLQPFLFKLCKVKYQGIYNHTSTNTFMSTVPRSEGAMNFPIKFLRRKVCLDCVRVWLDLIGTYVGIVLGTHRHHSGTGMHAPVCIRVALLYICTI